MSINVDGIEMVKCPWCGQMVDEGDTDRPADYCHHEYLNELDLPELDDNLP